MTKLHYATSKDPNLAYLLQYPGSISDPFYYLEHEGKQYVFLSAIDIGAFNAGKQSQVEAIAVGELANAAREQGGDFVSQLGNVILDRYQVSGAVVVPSNFPAGVADGLRALGVDLEVLTNWCPERGRKSPEEISALAAAASATTKAYEYIEQVLAAAAIEEDTIIYNSQVLTSERLKREVAKLLLDHDLTSPEGMIIASGVQAADPHHEGSGSLLPHSTIVVDIFPQHLTSHYFADMTRTYVKGDPLHKEVRKMYAAVAEAQRASLAALRPGISGKEAYEISANVIREHGFDVGEKGYIHSLGHGLGVEVHEAPNLSPRSDVVLEPGHVVTVEPGLYYPEWGGVRIEDTVVITEDGHQNLTNYPQNWQIP